jgi:hypothetical protein
MKDFILFGRIFYLFFVVFDIPQDFLLLFNNGVFLFYFTQFFILFYVVSFDVTQS